MSEISVKRLSDIIFSLMPEDIQKKYEKHVLGEVLTLKDQFICYCKLYRQYPKYSEEESKKIALEILKNPDLYKTEKFNLFVFRPLLGDYIADAYGLN